MSEIIEGPLVYGAEYAALRESRIAAEDLNLGQTYIAVIGSPEINPDVAHKVIIEIEQISPVDENGSRVVCGKNVLDDYTHGEEFIRVVESCGMIVERYGDNSLRVGYFLPSRHN